MPDEDSSRREERKRCLDHYLLGQQDHNQVNKKPKLETATGETSTSPDRNNSELDWTTKLQPQEAPSEALTNFTDHDDVDIKPDILPLPDFEVEEIPSSTRNLSAPKRILLMWCKYCGHRLKFHGVQECKAHLKFHEEALKAEEPQFVETEVPEQPLDLTLKAATSLNHSQNNNYEPLFRPQIPQEDSFDIYDDDKPLDLTISSLLKKPTSPTPTSAFTPEPSSPQIPTSTSTSNWPCDRCDRNFMTRGALSLHFQRAHSQQSRKLYPCEFCVTVFVYKSDWERHRRIHTATKSSQCVICLKSLPKGQFRPHLEAHKKKGHFTCRNCGSKFSNYSNLCRHLKSNNCKLQVQKYQNQPSSSTTTTMDHKCKICCQEFTSFTNLKKHMKLHTGGNKYQCNYCDVEFVRWEDLKAHLTSHTGEKPYECSVCERKFGHRSHLVLHRKIHSRNPSQKSNPVSLSVDKPIESARSLKDRKPQLCSICSQVLPCACDQQEKERHRSTFQYGNTHEQQSEEIAEEIIDEFELPFEVPQGLKCSSSSIGQELPQGDSEVIDHNNAYTNLDAIFDFDMEFCN